MSGDTNEQAAVSKTAHTVTTVTHLIKEMEEQIKKSLPNVKISVKEEYTLHAIKGHRITITYIATDTLTGEKTEVFRHTHKLSPNVPKWIT